MFRLSKKIQILVLVCIFSLVIACQINSALAEKPRRGGELKVAVSSSATGLDPHLTLTMLTLMYTEQVYEGLLRFNHKMEVEPSLAESWEIPDNVTYVFHLRKGVKFHNGQELTSDDVKFTFDRIRDPKSGALARPYFKQIKSVETPDKYTVKFTLTAPMAAFLNYCAFLRYSAILPKDELLKRRTMQKVMIGTGPFKLKEYRHGVGATYVRNDDYWDKPLPYLDGFEFIVMKDEASRLAAMRKGTIDIGMLVDVNTARRAAKIPNISIQNSADTMERFILNQRVFPFKHLKLRQALSACLDRQAMIDKVVLGKGRLSTLYPPFEPTSLSQEEIANLPFYKQDYKLAKKLLKEAGYPNGFEFTIHTSSYTPQWVPACEMIQEQAAKVGIKAKIINIADWAAYQKHRRLRKFQGNFYGASVKPDPTAYYMDYFRHREGENETGINDPELNRLMDLTMRTANPEKRKEYLRQVQYYVAEKVIAIFPYAKVLRFQMVSDKIKGYQFLKNMQQTYLRQAWIVK